MGASRMGQSHKFGRTNMGVVFIAFTYQLLLHISTQFLRPQSRGFDGTDYRGSKTQLF